MKKEIDTYKLDRLFDVFKRGILSGWYLSALIIGAALWFFPVQQTRIQVFVFSGVFCWYTILSVSIAKVEAIKQELSK